MVTAISLPGLTGPASPAANGPPGASSPAGHAAEGGVFAGVMAAAVDAAGVPGDGTATGGEARTMDLAQLLAGLHGEGESVTTGASVIALEVEHTIGQVRLDRLAGVERDEQSTLREAYEALMSAWLIQAPVTAPDGAARMFAGGAEALTAGTFAGEFAGDAAGSGQATAAQSASITAAAATSGGTGGTGRAGGTGGTGAPCPRA